MKFNGVITSLSFLLLLGSTLFTLFNILSGARTTGVLKGFHWLEADTRGLRNAPDTTKWYNYRYCEYFEQPNTIGRCSRSKAASAFSPRDNFGDTPALPQTFRNSRNTYYHLSRLAWAMLLISLAFMLMSLLPAIASIFTERAHIVSALPLWPALFFLTLAACFYTACFVKGRNGFRDAGRRANLGKKNFGFLWTSVFLLFLNCLWSTFASAFRAITNYRSRKNDTYYDPHSDASFDNSTAVHSGRGQGKGFFNSGKRQGNNYNGEVMAGNEASSFDRRFDNHAAYGAYNTNSGANPGYSANKDFQNVSYGTGNKGTTAAAVGAGAAGAAGAAAMSKDSSARSPQTQKNYSTTTTTANYPTQTQSQTHYQTQQPKSQYQTQNKNQNSYYNDTSARDNYTTSNTATHADPYVEDSGVYYGGVHKVSGKTNSPEYQATKPYSSTAGYDTGKPTINSTDYQSRAANTHTTDTTSGRGGYEKVKELGAAAVQKGTNLVRGH
ncbi:HBR531Wp [Eremothecium sinecaudum]|uniref:HBR531Wp n=1 Tax=Eremothecium sinecaudum TaxID=45286 RepID=A0A109UYE9_9SACH|nr:HBR531Wp [Eremothecium sinecaudum]AMD19432.1 HBR531Wp [Eremothecium sinecaudum]